MVSMEEFRKKIYQMEDSKDYQREYIDDLKKLWTLIWRRDDLTEAYEFQDEMNKKWEQYPPIKEI